MKYNFLSTKSILLIIVLLAAILRFWGVSQVPPSLYWDEVSQAYNAYSVLTTGYDEHHEFLPVARFQAFGDYKAPVSIYLDVLSLAAFGKNTFAVRFPSALLGTLTILAAFGLVYELFYRHKQRNTIALLAAFLLAISPWHIQLSRALYEGNIATFFTVLGAYLFFLARRTNPWWCLACSVSFVLGIYAFNSQRVFIPLLLILLGIIYCKDIWKQKQQVIVGIVLGAILLIPFVLFLLTPESKLRFNEVNIFSDISVINESNQLIALSHNSPIAKIFDNRRVLFAESYVKHYLDFFNPNYLFFTGDVNPRFSDQHTGELFLFMLPLLVIGFFSLFSLKSRSKWVIIGWFLLAPVGAATARETPHALRGETYIPLYETIAALGAVGLWLFIRQYFSQFTKACIAVGGVIVVISLYLFLHNYYVHFPTEYSGNWQYGYQQTVDAVQAMQSKYDTVAFTTQYGRPYIYLLWYGNISPQTFWKEGNVQKDAFGLYNVYSVGKYQFRNSLVSTQDLGKKVLYIASPTQVTPEMHVLKTINFLDGSPAFVIADNS